jgi:outer membrane protein OmpA-like peptidoglycan-associated protein
VGNPAVGQLLGHESDKGRFRIGPPGDIREREAEQTARKAVRKSDPSAGADIDSREFKGSDSGGESSQDPSRMEGPELDSRILALRGQGKPLPAEVRDTLAPEVQSPAREARIHTDHKAADTARAVNSSAFTVGRDIVFGDNHYAPDTSEGRSLLSHELSHVGQSETGESSGVISRRKLLPGEETKKTRELDPSKVPSTFNYELIHHKLIAHTSSKADIKRITNMLSILSLYAGEKFDETAVTAKLEAAWKGAAATSSGGRVDLDITPFLPANIRKYLAEMEEFYKKYRAHVKKKGRTLDEVFDEYNKLFKKAKTPAETKDIERKQDAAVKDWYSGEPPWPKEYHAACHQFLMLITSGAATGTTPGAHAGPKYETPLGMSLADILASYQDALRGKGEYRLIKRSEVRPGDVVVFRTGVPIKGKFGVGGVIHSALVIRVSGGEIEVLEKTNPHDPMATRTVGEILKRYSKEKATAAFLSPTLSGLPGKSPSRIGATKPAGSYTETTGKAPEDTFVLFKVNTNVTRPHEDIKLFRLIAETTAPVNINVHGYASEEGEEAYNMNLSAHRAVAAAEALRMHLPKGSTINAFARGETTAFGAPADNRRVGIEIVKPPAGTTKPTAPKAPKPPASKPPARKPPRKIDLFPDLRHIIKPERPPWLPSPPRSEGPAPDVSSVAEAFRKRGRKLSDRELKAILKNQSSARKFFETVLPPPLRTPEILDWLSKKATAMAYDRELGREAPNVIEQLEKPLGAPTPRMLSTDYEQIKSLWKKIFR